MTGFICGENGCVPTPESEDPAEWEKLGLTHEAAVEIIRFRHYLREKSIHGCKSFEAWKEITP